MESRPGDRLRILLVSHYVLPHTGGIEVLVDQLGRALARDGHEVAMVASGERTETRDIPGLPLRVSTVRAWNGLERSLHVPWPVFAPSLLPILFREIRHAEVVHVHGLLYLGSLASLLFCLLLGKPLVVSEHVGFVEYPNALLNLLERGALFVARLLFRAGADAVISYNLRVRDWLREGGSWAAEEMMVPGIDVERFRPPRPEERAAAREALGAREGRVIVLFTGRLVSKKRPELLVAAADPSFDIALCGPGEPPSPLPAGTIVTGEVGHDRIVPILHAGDIFCLPSHGEGFPVALCEALAAGLPAVVARDPLYDSCLSERELTQAEAEPEALRTALRSLALDPEARARQGAAGSERASGVFGVDAVARRHEAIFRKALSSRRPRAGGFRSLIAILMALGGSGFVLLGINPDRARPWLEHGRFQAGTSPWTLSLSHEADPRAYYALSPENDRLVLENGAVTWAGPSGEWAGRAGARVRDTWRTLRWMTGWPSVSFEAKGPDQHAVYEWRPTASGFALSTRVTRTRERVASWRHRFSLHSDDRVVDSSGRALKGEATAELWSALHDGAGSRPWIAIYNPKADAAFRVRIEAGDRVRVEGDGLWIERDLGSPTLTPQALLRIDIPDRLLSPSDPR